MKAAGGLSEGDVIADKYRLDRTLGEGGMGRVFLARHELTGRRVALKLVPAADQVTRERLLREARSMGRLSHPNVVGVLDMGEWGGAVFLVMEYFHGENLRQFAGSEPMELEAAIKLILPVCSGVAAVHQAGILHRDLKPENLFVCTDHNGKALDTKVLDFGVAKALESLSDNLSLTDNGTMVGTPRYMAPEQMVEDPVLDERTDVYALALILYEMLAGRLPYTTSNLRYVVLEILKGEFPTLHEVRPSVPVELSKVVMRALSGDVDDRYGNVSEFATALEPWAGGRSFMPPLDVHSTKDSWLPPPSSAPTATPNTTRDQTPGKLARTSDAGAESRATATTAGSGGGRTTRKNPSAGSRQPVDTDTDSSSTALRPWPLALGAAAGLALLLFLSLTHEEASPSYPSATAPAAAPSAAAPPGPAPHEHKGPMAQPEVGAEPQIGAPVVGQDAATGEQPAHAETAQQDSKPAAATKAAPARRPKTRKARPPKARRDKPQPARIEPPDAPVQPVPAGRVTDNRNPWAP